MSKQYGVSEDLFPFEKPRLNFSFREMATCAVPRRVIDIPDACFGGILEFRRKKFPGSYSYLMPASRETFTP